MEYSNVTRLNLASNRMEDEGALLLAKAIPKFKQEIYIDVTNNGIRQRGFTAVY
jgi:Leucine Rich repeat